MLGTVDEAAAHGQVHTGAVHVHQGQTYVVTELDLGRTPTRGAPGDPGWTTHAQSVSAFDIGSVQHRRGWGRGGAVASAPCDVRSQVTSFLRRLPSR